MIAKRRGFSQNERSVVAHRDMFHALPPELWHFYILPRLHPRTVVVLSETCRQAHRLIHSSKTPIATAFMHLSVDENMDEDRQARIMLGLERWSMPDAKTPRFLFPKLHLNVHPTHAYSVLQRHAKAITQAAHGISFLGFAHNSFRPATCALDQAHLRMLGTMHTLHLENVTTIRDVSMLAHVHRLDLSNCSAVTDVSPLRNVDNLCLQSCAGVKDVSALGAVRVLNLVRCQNVTDVSMLGGVQSLCLRDCQGVTDVGALGSVHHLDISGCQGITDVSALGSVKVLDLSDCPQVHDVSALSNVHELSINNCGEVTDVSALGAVRWLDMADCNKVTDVSMLGSVHGLRIARCDRIVDVSALGKVHTLCLESTNVSDVSALGGVRHLCLADCRNVTFEQIHALSAAQRLSIAGRPDLLVPSLHNCAHIGGDHDECSFLSRSRSGLLE